MGAEPVGGALRERGPQYERLEFPGTATKICAVRLVPVCRSVTGTVWPA
jgi:hypothetical protein